MKNVKVSKMNYVLKHILRGHNYEKPLIKSMALKIENKLVNQY